MNKFSLFVLFTFLAVGCAHTSSQTSHGSVNNNDLDAILTQLGATAQGSQPDGSFVACEDSQKWGGDLNFTADVVQLNASAMAVEAAQKRVEHDESPIEVRTESRSRGVMRGNQFVTKYGERWVCVKQTSASVDSY